MRLTGPSLGSVTAANPRPQPDDAEPEVLAAGLAAEHEVWMSGQIAELAELPTSAEPAKSESRPD